MVTKGFLFHPQISQMAQGPNGLYNTVDGSEIKKQPINGMYKTRKQWDKLATFILFTTVAPRSDFPNSTPGPQATEYYDRFVRLMGNDLELRQADAWMT